MEIQIPTASFDDIDSFEEYNKIIFQHDVFVLILAKIDSVLQDSKACDWDSQEEAEIKRCRIEKRRSEKLTGKWCVKKAFQFLNQGEINIHSDSHAPKVYRNGKQLTDWFVSISHSHGWVGAAVSKTKIGFDLEKQRFFKDSLRGFFCNDFELSQLSRLKENEVQICSLQFFCGKEAILKTLGLGIAGGPEKAIVKQLQRKKWVDAEYLDRQFKVFFTRPQEMGLCICLDNEIKFLPLSS